MEFFALFWELLKGYVTHGYMFAVGHLVVMLFIYSSWRQITRETKSLENWEHVLPKKSAGSGGDQSHGVLGLGPERTKPDNVNTAKTTEILDQFVDDSERLGPQGFFVPMTDFSDRLDSTVDGMLGELHDRTNLLLIVGIAGTLFGVFEFAFSSYQALTSHVLQESDKVLKLGELLSSSMSKAFPVGFAGLMLTLVAQIFAAFPERKLRAALSEATSKALQRRKEVSVSQAAIVRQSAQSIQIALRPLENLESTLTGSIQPVVTEFGKRLDQSLHLVKAQFEQLEPATRGVHTAVEAVAIGVDSLQRAAESLSVLLGSAPDVLSNLGRIQQHQQASLEAFDENLRQHQNQAQQITTAIIEAGQSLRILSADVRRLSQHALEQLTAESLSVWQGVSNEFTKKAHADYQGLLDEISARAQGIQQSVSLALNEVKELAQNADIATERMAALPDQIVGGINAAFVAMSNKSFVAWDAMLGEFARGVQNAHLGYLTTIEDKSEAIRMSVQGATGELQRLAQTSQILLQEPIRGIIEDAKVEVSAGLRKLDQGLMQRYPKALEDIQTLTEGLGELLTKVRSVQEGFAVWLQQTHEAHVTITDIHSALATVLGEIRQVHFSPDTEELNKLLRGTIDELKVMNAGLRQGQRQSTPSRDGIDAKLQESIRILTRISEDINRVATKEGLFARARRKFGVNRPKV